MTLVGYNVFTTRTKTNQATQPADEQRYRYR